MLFNAVNKNSPCGSQFCALQVLAMLASATLHTIAIRARAGTARPELEKLARKAVAAICGREP